MKKASKIIIAALLLLLIPGILLAAEIRLPHFYGDSYYAQLAPMVQRLEKAPGQKLVLVGGSSVAFGTDTELLEETLASYGYSYTVCPMGLYAAVGSSAMLELTQRSLQPGDMVILAIEPTEETMSTYFGATAYWKCAESDIGLVWALGSEKRTALVGSYIPYLQERWGIWESGLYPKAEGVYSRAAFSPSCNMVYPREGNTMTLGFDPAAPIDLSALSFDEAFVRQVNSFCAEAQRKGAAVYWSFSPMNRSAVTDASRQVLEEFFSRCNQTFLCPIISDPTSYILDSGWFYDSNFHLNSAGATVRTQQLAADILTALGCTQATAFETPAMPASIAAPLEATTGDDGFLFTPVENGGGWLVAGLNDSGLQATALTVPSTHDGLPVVGFAEGALMGASLLEELRLPSSILFLPEGMFRGCTSLSRLILEHTDIPCAIDAHTLDDVPQVHIFVPKRAYTLYRDGYGCQQNQWAAYLDRIFAY